MKELNQGFDYCSIDEKTAQLLKEKEASMSGIVGQAYTDLGKELKEARDHLSKNGYGCFGEWFESLGFKKDQVYRWIGRYELILANCDKREMIEEMPVSLTYEMARPSANQEVVKAALDGEIKTRKEFIELEKALQAAEQRAAQAEATATVEKNTAQHYEKLWNQAKNQPPQVMVETKTIEVVPDSVTREMEKLRFENTDLRHGYKTAREKIQAFEMQNTVDFDAEQSRKQREKLQHEAEYNTLQLRVHITNFMEKVAVNSYMTGAIAASDPITKKKLQEGVDMLEEFTNQIKAALKGRILGGIVNE